MNQPAELPDDRLCVVVFGPGYGESVVVRTPCGAWLVVDSLRDPTTGINPALRLLRANDAQASCLILTHPHEDHAAGFEDLVAGHPGALVGYIEVSGANAFDPLRDPDAERGLRTGRAEHAVAAIRDRWDSDPASRWSLALGDMRMLGEAAIRVLSPHRDAVAEARRKGAEDLNRLSAALAIEWKGVRLVLGADVPASQWRRIVRDHPTSAPGEHAGLKVPHHGSQASQHPALAEPVDGRPRCWMLTPWSRGRMLPRLEDGEGMELMLSRVPEVHTSSLPVDVSLSGDPQVASRGDLSRSIARSRFGGSDLVLEYHRSPPTSAEAWVAAAFSADGSLERLMRGRSAWTVRA